jgi:glucosyl-3-phosphoglycerate synthase
VHHHSAFPWERVAAERGDLSVSVCVPALNEAPTIGAISSSLVRLRERGVVDQAVVVDGGSIDGTAALASAAGAEVYEQAALLPEFGPVLGKGDALWRALSVLHGDVVVFVDGDSSDFGEHFVCGLLGPLVCDGASAPPAGRFAAGPPAPSGRFAAGPPAPSGRSAPPAFVKASYRRPFRVGEETLAEGGGRVTELTARPLLRLFFPELASFGQPLAGEFAARRELLERLPFATGYGVESGLLIDVWRTVGIERMAEVDLDVRQNRHQPLSALGAMAETVAATILSRAGHLPPTPDRPPLKTLSTPA